VGRRDWAHLGAIAILIPAIAVPVYLYLGMPSLIPVLGVLEAEGSTDGAAHGSSAASLDGLVAALARRLEQNPRDQEGLSLLGKSYLALERFAEAAATYEKLLALTGDRADVLLAYADALAMANQGKIAGRPEELVQRALKLEPESVTGLWLAGLAAFELGRYEDALDYWTTLQPKLEAGSPDVAEIERLIAEANAALGKPVAATAAETPAAAVAEGGATLTVSVELTPEMAAQTKPDQVVFIFARAVNGPPMPLAVAQRRVADLPVEVRLDDSMAMTPEARLSGFPEVDVGARVSISGDAVARSGDFEAESVRAQTTAKEPVRLRIASKRP
jgi:cytochrome c-type biogenesis protein CcmH